MKEKQKEKQIDYYDIRDEAVLNEIAKEVKKETKNIFRLTNIYKNPFFLSYRNEIRVLLKPYKLKLNELRNLFAWSLHDFKNKEKTELEKFQDQILKKGVI